MSASSSNVRPKRGHAGGFYSPVPLPPPPPPPSPSPPLSPRPPSTRALSTRALPTQATTRRHTLDMGAVTSAYGAPLSRPHARAYGSRAPTPSPPSGWDQENVRPCNNDGSVETVTVGLAGARFKCLLLKDWPCKRLAEWAIADFKKDFPACEVPEWTTMYHVGRKAIIKPSDRVGRWCRDGDEIELLMHEHRVAPSSGQARPRVASELAFCDFTVVFHRRPFGFFVAHDKDTTVVANVAPESAVSHYEHLVRGTVLIQIGGTQLKNLGSDHVKAILRTCELPVAVQFRGFVARRASVNMSTTTSKTNQMARHVSFATPTTTSEKTSASSQYVGTLHSQRPSATALQSKQKPFHLSDGEFELNETVDKIEAMSMGEPGRQDEEDVRLYSDDEYEGLLTEMIEMLSAKRLKKIESLKKLESVIEQKQIKLTTIRQKRQSATAATRQGAPPTSGQSRSATSRGTGFQRDGSGDTYFGDGMCNNRDDVKLPRERVRGG